MTPPAAEPRSRWDTTTVRCIATLLIANSHLESYYPYRWLAADGLLGNALFFIVSGVGLGLSDRSSRISFLPWYWGRIRRIYPSLWIALCLGMLLRGTAHVPSLLEAVRAFVWPTDYQFIQDIMLFYVGLFWLTRAANMRLLRISWLSAFAWMIERAVHAARTIPEASRLSLGAIDVHFWQAVWLVALLSGLLLTKVPQPLALSRRMVLGTLALSLSAFVVMKFSMVVMGMLPRAFVLLPICAIVGGLALVLAGARDDIWGWLPRSRHFQAPLHLLSAMTLEVYVTHRYVLESAWVQQQPFPFNLCVFAVGALAFAYVVKRMSHSLGTTAT